MCTTFYELKVHVHCIQFGGLFISVLFKLEQQLQKLNSLEQNLTLLGNGLEMLLASLTH